MKTGRRPQSVALKLLRGNPGQHKLRTDEPVAVLGTPDKPADLGPHASAEWDRLVRLLDGEHRLSVSDAPHILTASKAYASARAFEAQADAAEDSHDWRHFKTGERIAWDAYRKTVNDLCLSQGTRARAKVGTAGQPSKIDQFLARRS